MKRSLSTLLLFSCVVAHSQQTRHYVRAGNTITCGNARFEFMTPTMGRMEYSPSKEFVDQRTVVVVRRDFPTCQFEVAEKSGWLVVSSRRLTLKYRIGSGRFTPENVRLSWRTDGTEHSWVPGQVDTGNLGGVTYSLDGTRQDKPPQFPDGILSRSGYFILDDSKSPTWNDSTNWIEPRKETGNQDWYWIVYGNDYAHALKEYSDLAGKIPMIPRYVLGTWITDLNYEYLPGSEKVEKYKYSDNDVKTLVEKFRKSGIPLDVLVLDFAWHKFGWKGGFDWSPIFPHPKAFLAWAHEHGIKVSLNDHPGYAREGVLSTEDSHAEEIIRDLNITELPKPSYTIDLSRDWRFKVDSLDIGMKDKWYSVDLPDSTWEVVQAGIDWEEQGHPGYDGYGWYRKRIAYPDVPPGSPILLMFGGVDDEYDLFVNGVKVAHRGSRGSSIWNSLTSKDVTSLLKKDTENTIVLRVNDWGGGGGISKLPVALTDRLPSSGIRFNLAEKKEAEVFMDVLHNPLIDEGVDFWWIDGGKGACEMDGLDGQMWTNRVYYDFTQDHTKKRAFIFSRYGGWGNHRYPGIFTGDTYSEWAVLDYEVIYSAQAGNVLMPYVTHDIGGFLGRKIPFDLYARWIQFGVFNPLLRLHSAFENPKDGNLRMPWNYGKEGMDFVKRYFELRYRLLPYIYSYSRVAYDQAMPLCRPLYLEYPDLEDSYKHPDEYFFGKEFLSAPIVDSTGERDVYLPPGRWFDYFSGRQMDGGKTFHTRHTLEDFPLFVKSGSIIPTQPNVSYSDEKPLDSLIIDIYGRERSQFNLYEDDGITLDFKDGAFAWTPVECRPAKGQTRITVGPTKGRYSGQPLSRAYAFVLHGYNKPHSVSLDGRILKQGERGIQSWSWDPSGSRLTIIVGRQSIRKPLTVGVTE